jgi:hypothetical protein
MREMKLVLVTAKPAGKGPDRRLPASCTHGGSMRGIRQWREHVRDYYDRAAQYLAADTGWRQILAGRQAARKHSQRTCTPGSQPTHLEVN